MDSTQLAAASFAAFLSLALPAGGMLYLGRRRWSWPAFCTGVSAFIIFAMFLEPLMHQLVLTSPAGEVIQNNIWLYGLYGGLAAGVFEETGRLVAFRFALKKYDRPVTPLSYGLGHGGIEAVLVTGVTVITSESLAMMYSFGNELDPELEEMALAAIATPWYNYLLSAFERVCAVALHISLSVLVFAAVRKKECKYFAAALGLHAALDAVIAVLASFIPAYTAEGVAALLTAGVAFYAKKVYDSLPPGTEPEPSEAPRRLRAR